jgi:peptidoglycan/xylan/chitin deacetylase (PgdA/CDA1 family)
MRIFKTPKFFRWIYPGRIWGFSRLEKKVFLTFDDGPDPTITPWVLDYLKKENVKATFFCVGQNIEKNLSLFNQTIAEGHLCCNHTDNHARGIKTGKKEYLDAVNAAEKHFDNNFFRPPYGRMTLGQYRAVKKSHKIVMWSWLSYDFDLKVSVENILKSAQKIKNGDILVLHDNAKMAEKLKELLPLLIQDIKTKGFEFGLISDAYTKERSNKVRRT